MRKRRRSEPAHENVDRWMVSYADFVTLLFCFFTAMYAISNVDSNKLGKFAESMRMAFSQSGTRGNAISVIEGVQVFIPTNVELETSMKDVLKALLSKSGGDINVKRDRRGVVVSIADKYFYESGSAELKGKSGEVLDKIASVLQEYRNMIRIEGHTDNIPIQNSDYPSNWELSASRAINVAKYFMSSHNIQPDRISTIGYSEFKPVASNDTPEGRAKNRRVEIIMLTEEESIKEPG